MVFNPNAYANAEQLKIIQSSQKLIVGSVQCFKFDT